MAELQRGVLEENVAFIGKPFSRDDLAHKVRDVLEWTFDAGGGFIMGECHEP